MRKAWLAVGVAVVLAGCGRTPPPRRPGLWYQSFAQDGSTKNLGAMRALRVCIGPQTDNNNAIFNYDLAVKLARQRHCDPPQASRGLDGIYKFASNCPLPNGNGMSLLQGTATGDFTSRYHLRMQTDTNYSPPFTTLNSHQVTDVDGKWLGDCPAGMAPGDMVLASGEKAPGGVVPKPLDPSMHPHNPLPHPPS